MQIPEMQLQWELPGLVLQEKLGHRQPQETVTKDFKNANKFGSFLAPTKIQM